MQAHLAGWLARRAPTTVLIYLASAHEIDVTTLAADRRHRWATTRTPELGPLTVHPLGPPFERHRLGFLQPVAASPTLPLEDIGVVLVPGLAFGLDGTRLGHGGGHYDRLLGGLRRTDRIGVTVEGLVVSSLPTEGHDVAMNLIATEAGIRTVSVNDSNRTGPPRPGRRR